MPDETPTLKLPYPLPEDALVDYPGLGQDLAETIEGLGGLVKLWDSLEAGVVFPVATITPPAIPATFKHLLLAYAGQADGASDTLCLRINSIADASYRDQWLQGLSGSPAAGEGYAVSYIRCGHLGIGSSGAYGGAGVVLIPGYASVAEFCPPVIGLSGGFLSAATGQYKVGVWAGMSAGSSYVVGSISIFPSSGSFRSGRFTLYGVG